MHYFFPFCCCFCLRVSMCSCMRSALTFPSSEWERLKWQNSSCHCCRGHILSHTRKHITQTQERDRQTDWQRKRPPGTTSSCHPLSRAALVQREHTGLHYNDNDIHCTVVYRLCVCFKAEWCRILQYHHRTKYFILYFKSIMLCGHAYMCVRVFHVYVLTCSESDQRWVVESERPFLLKYG